MRKIYIALTLYLFFSLGNIQAQEYGISMYFEDALGNLDTVFFGIDSLSTRGVDMNFNEVNILGTPRKQGLDVRISDIQESKNFGSQPSFSMKRQVTPNARFVSSVDVATKNFPVTVSWDSTYAKDVLKTAVFTGVNPGGWWDTGSPAGLYKILLNSASSVNFETNARNFNTHYAYVDGTDTIPVYWFSFFADCKSDTKDLREMGPDVYPNPTEGELIIVSKDKFDISMFNSNGLLVLSAKSVQNFDVSSLEKGIYFLRLENVSSDKVYSKKINVLK